MKGNYVSLRPTKEGLAVCKEHVTDAEIGKIVKKIENTFDKIETSKDKAKRAA